MLASALMNAFARTEHLRKTWWFGVCLGTIGFLIALWTRFAFGDTMSGYPYVTFFPVVVLTTFFGGAPAGLATAVASGMAAWYFFIPPQNSFALIWPSTYVALGFYALVVGVEILLITSMDLGLSRLRAEQARTAALLAQQQTLFTELQHRVANNMAFVASLLMLQRRKVGRDTQAGEALEEARLRIDTMAQIHRRLYDPAIVSLPVGPYLQDLCSDILKASGSRNVSCRVDAPDATLDIGRLLPLSLIITEVITNSLKHAFAADENGTIHIILTQSSNGFQLTVQDDGRGFPDGFDTAQTRSLGMRVIQGLTAQIGGSVDFASQQGARTTVAVPA